VRRPAALALALTALALVLVTGSGARPAETVVVAHVTDGDTVRLADGRRVRLLQIDTPELGTGECYSRAARTALLALVPAGSKVVLEADPALDRVDRYGRLLRYIRRGRTNVNLELVRRGAGAPYFFEGDRGRYAAALLAAARSARAAKRGLWGACPHTVLDPDRQVDTGGGASPHAAAPSAARPLAGGSCDPSYPGACIPPPPPDLDCDDIRKMGAAPVRVTGADPHRLDGDGDGWGCE
jgi:micrococcal nuclease